MFDAVLSVLRPDTRKQSEPKEGQFYIRTGNCHQCGACCTNIYLIHMNQTIASLEEFEALKVHNPEYEYFEPVGEDDEPGGGLLFKCRHLQADNRCGIYEKRPSFCRRYPSEEILRMGGKLAENCGYRFQLKQTFSQVLAKEAGKNKNERR